MQKKIDNFPEEFSSDIIFERIIEKFRKIAICDIPEYFVDELVKDLIEINDPVIFTKKWVSKKAMLPFSIEPNNNPLYIEDIREEIKTSEIPIIKELPLVFPLPEYMHKKISDRIQRKIQSIRF